ncbi:MAG: glutamyl-tRNA reductase [Sphingobacteriaceae bacterium]|nr:glutamyl-tRNA reductase [Sphingobacteriaceae bacterium]
MESLKVIAFTHKTLPFELIGKLHLDAENQSAVLGALKINYGFEELLYLSTCNRVELILKTEILLDNKFIQEICNFINSRLNLAECEQIAIGAEVFIGELAVDHLLRVASSLDSMVVGEREIITQVRKAYDNCNSLGLTGDTLRLLVRHTIETAKEVYTKTDIAKNPVSIVSLAYRQLKEHGIKNNAKLIFVGSGETNSTMASYLQKHKFANFSVFNRTLENAKILAKTLNGQAYSLEELQNYKAGFDVLVVCTSASSPIITNKLYKQLIGSDKHKKIIIDLGIPANVEDEVFYNNDKIHYINIQSLKEKANANLQLRKGEIAKCENIIQDKIILFNRLQNERRIELAFGEIPKQVKAIKETAISEVFAKEINQLNPESKVLLEKVLSYVEKKYNAVAIKTAKNVLQSPELK